MEAVKEVRDRGREGEHESKVTAYSAYLEVRDVIAPQAADVAGSEALQDSLHLTGNRAEGQWRAPCSEVELLAGRVHLGQLSIAAHCCPQDKQVGVVGVVGGAVELWPSRALSGGTLTHRG